MPTSLKNAILVVFLTISFLIAMPAWSVEVSLNSDTNADEQRHPGSYSRKMLLKNWALTVCMGRMMHNQEDKRDYRKSAASYFEFSNSSIEEFDMIDKVVYKYLGMPHLENTKSIFSGNFDAQRCINLYRSKELERLTRKISKNRPYTYGLYSP
jgi:hypothetical protein